MTNDLVVHLARAALVNSSDGWWLAYPGLDEDSIPRIDGRFVAS